MWTPIILDVECIVCNKSLQKINHNPREVTRKMGKMANNRRLRTPNWSVEEKHFLLELIKQRKEIVVTKANNGPNHYEEKHVAWNEILRELAAKFGSKFIGSSTKKVKTQWQNMKRIAREEIAANGPKVNSYSKLSLDVCEVLELMKDGVPTAEQDTSNDGMISTNIEIKTERIEEDINQPQPGCSGMSTSQSTIMNDTTMISNSNDLESTSSSMSDLRICEPHELDTMETINLGSNVETEKKNASSMTDLPFAEDTSHFTNMFQRDVQDYFKFSASEKELKMESLKEERQVLRAMRETAELNKIVAEQKLKHVLWVKKQEMAMYSGEPGSGAGRGGGGGGSIREAGGSFGKMEAAREEEYFYKKQKEQLSNLKTHLNQEISFHEEQIKRHEDAIRRHKQKMGDLDKQS